MDIIAVGYIDREIIKENTGRQNVVTKKDITINKVASESRVIAFRDDNYSIDSKCRFANIVDKIPFDADEFIKAIQDAIKAEFDKNGVSMADAKKKQVAKDKKAKEDATEYSKKSKENRKIDPDRNAELIDIIKEKFPSASDEVKAAVKEVMTEYGINNFKEYDETPTACYEKIVTILS